MITLKSSFSRAYDHMYKYLGSNESSENNISLETNDKDIIEQQFQINLLPGEILIKDIHFFPDKIQNKKEKLSDLKSNRKSRYKSYDLISKPPLQVSRSVDSLLILQKQNIKNKQENQFCDFIILESQQDFQNFNHQNPVTMFENQYSDYVILEECTKEDLQENKLVKPLSQDDWNQIVKQGSFSGFAHNNIYYSLLRGVPFLVRKDIWFLMANVEQLKAKYKSVSYLQLAKQQTCEQTKKQIQIDISRTFRNNNKFINDEEFQQMLYKILTAYANFDPEIGYVQSMSFIAGNILINLDPNNDKELLDFFVIDTNYEERVFWILVHIMQEKKWRYLMLDGTPMIYPMLNKLKDKIIQQVPKIYNHIIECELDMTVCFAQYFFTILLYNVPRTFAKRILDLFLFEGEQMLYGITINMLKICQDHILQLKQEVFCIIMINSFKELKDFFKRDILYQCDKKYKEQRTKMKNETVQFNKCDLNYAQVTIIDMNQSF